MKLLTSIAMAFWLVVPAQAGPWQPFTGLCESSDGRFLATGGLHGEVLWWEVATGEVLKKWQLDDLPVAAVEFGAAGSTLAAVLTDGRAFLLSGAGDAPQKLVLPGSPWGRLASPAATWKAKGSAMSGTLSTHGAVQARGFPDGTIVVSGLPQSDEVSWTAHLSAVTGLAWSPDGGVLTSCSFDGALAQWDPRTGKLLSRL